jgi:beta-RFAP synthase
MTEAPGLEVVVEPADEMSASGPHSERALELAAAISQRLAASGRAVGPVRVTVASGPRLHVGLGVGTQLAMSIARALTALAGLDASAEDLASLCGRGQRSGIGIHGFAHGGLIVDAGRRIDGEIPTRLINLPFPPDWSVLIVIPEKCQGLNGAEEIRAFRDLAPMPEPISDRICGLVLLGLLPAVVEKDLEAFGFALSEVQSLVGTGFASVQGGRFASPELEAIVRRMRSLGLHGVGQSSWGPTLYGFSSGQRESREDIRLSLMDEFGLPSDNVLWTAANPTGATVHASPVLRPP